MCIRDSTHIGYAIQRAEPTNLTTLAYVQPGSLTTGPHLCKLLRRHSHCCSHLCPLGWAHSLQQLSHLRSVVRLASTPEDKREEEGDAVLIPCNGKSRNICIPPSIHISTTRRAGNAGECGYIKVSNIYFTIFHPGCVGGSRDEPHNKTTRSTQSNYLTSINEALVALTPS